MKKSFVYQLLDEELPEGKNMIFEYVGSRPRKFKLVSKKCNYTNSKKKE